MKKALVLFGFALLVTLSGSGFSVFNAQSPANRDTVILAAHEIINETTYCGLVHR